MINKLFTRKNILLIIDSTLVVIGYFLSFAMTLNSTQFKEYLYTFKQSFFLAVIIYISVYYFNKMYEQMWRYADAREYQLCAITSLVSGAIFVVTSEIAGYNIPIRIQIVSPVVILFLVILSRIAYKIVIQKEKNRRSKAIHNMESKNKDIKLHKLAIVGAGDAGVQLLREIKNNGSLKYEPVCFIDDNFQKIGRNIFGIDILGPINEVLDIVERNNIDSIIIAIPSASPSEKKRIVELCSETKCSIKILPGIPNMLKSSEESELDNNTVLIGRLRSIEVEDLLSRDTIKIDDEGIKNYIKNKTILVTGGGGSIGSEICRQVVGYGAKKLIILDNYENNAYEIEQELKREYGFTPQVEILTVREYEALDNFFYEHTSQYGKIDVVFHAAAHKHVPLMEHNPEQALRNNVLGTYNVARLCDKYKVDRMVLISTDKAVNPTNVMGATKRVCEMIVQAMNKNSATIYTAVRFGNVLGSNGSVIPLFKKQIEKGGPITVTHPDIIRYFMTIPEAVSLVLNSGGIANGGEIFVLDMGEPVKIVDLAKNMIRLSGLKLGEDINIEFTGLRPGEKLFEELLMAEEGLKTTKSDKIFIGKLTEIDDQELFKWIETIKDTVFGLEKNNVVEELVKVVDTFKPNR